jgi:hypothetical protein
MANRIIAAVTALILLSGCAFQPNRERLTLLNQQCAGGNTYACEAVPEQESINRKEAATRVLKAAAIAVMIPVVVGLAAVQATAAGQPGAGCVFLAQGGSGLSC